MSDRTLPGIQREKKPLWPAVLVLGIGFVAVVAFGVAALSGPEAEYDANTSYEAIAQCEAAIEKRLKSPSTARFESDATGDGTWTVTGTVDAENSFGAVMRTPFQCTVQIDNVKDTARVRVDSFG